MSKMEIKIISGISIFILLVILLFTTFGKNKKHHSKNEYPYEIVKKWELPEILKEVSDIAWIGKNKLAAVQDEDGIVFVYDLKNSKILRQISFAGDGDYEGLAINGNTVYVVRSDGKIFELDNLKQESPNVAEHETPLTEKQDIEGLAFDKKNNRLLLSIKEKEPGNKNYKGIYAFNLKTKKLLPEPVYKIKFDDPIFKNLKVDEKEDLVKPTEIALHPKKGTLFVLDGAAPSLMVFDKKGGAQKIYPLDEELFPQPEGLAFSPTGKMYLSNEGKKQPATILWVQLKK